MQALVLATSLLAPPTSDACVAPTPSDISGLKEAASEASRAGNFAPAAELWQRAAELYPPCATTIARRTDLLIRALNALALSPAPAETPCDSPHLRAARLIRRTHAELMALPDDAPGIGEDRAEFSGRLARLAQPASDAAALLDDSGPQPVPVVLQRYASATAAFGACPQFRSALVHHVLAALPWDLPAPPSCAPASEAARELLRQGMEVLERSEPDTAKATAEYIVLSQRHASLMGMGPALTSARADAAAAADPDAAASAWATIARALPSCARYLATKHDAALAAVLTWQRPGEHATPVSERDHHSRAVLDHVIAEIEAEYGVRATALPEHLSLTRARAALDRPPPPSPLPPVRDDPPDRWISRHRPERNLLELGVFGGVMAPASGLFDDPRGSHQLFDAYKLREAGESFYRPYRKIAPEIGLRLAWHPLAALGAELEGALMPTRVVSAGTPGERATLFHLRAHLVGQIPLWRITPFILIGGGALGTTGALGRDVDPSLNLGGGVKIYLSQRFTVRLDVRDNIAARRGIRAGGTHYPEVLLGLSLTLNRRRPHRAAPKP